MNYLISLFMCAIFLLLSNKTKTQSVNQDIYVIHRSKREHEVENLVEKCISKINKSKNSDIKEVQVVNNSVNNLPIRLFKREEIPHLHKPLIATRKFLSSRPHFKHIPKQINKKITHGKNQERLVLGKIKCRESKNQNKAITNPTVKNEVKMNSSNIEHFKITEQQLSNVDHLSQNMEQKMIKVGQKPTMTNETARKPDDIKGKVPRVKIPDFFEEFDDEENSKTLKKKTLEKNNTKSEKPSDVVFKIDNNPSTDDTESENLFALSNNSTNTLVKYEPNPNENNTENDKQTTVVIEKEDLKPTLSNEKDKLPTVVTAIEDLQPITITEKGKQTTAVTENKDLKPILINEEGKPPTVTTEIENLKSTLETEKGKQPMVVTEKKYLKPPLKNAEVKPPTVVTEIEDLKFTLKTEKDKQSMVVTEKEDLKPTLKSGIFKNAEYKPTVFTEIEDLYPTVKIAENKLPTVVTEKEDLKCTFKIEKDKLKETKILNTIFKKQFSDIEESHDTLQAVVSPKIDVKKCNETEQNKKENMKEQKDARHKTKLDQTSDNSKNEPKDDIVIENQNLEELLEISEYTPRNYFSNLYNQEAYRATPQYYESKFSNYPCYMSSQNMNDYDNNIHPTMYEADYTYAKPSLQYPFEIFCDLDQLYGQETDNQQNDIIFDINANANYKTGDYKISNNPGQCKDRIWRKWENRQIKIKASEFLKDHSKCPYLNNYLNSIVNGKTPIQENQNIITSNGYYGNQNMIARVPYYLSPSYQYTNRERIL